MPTLFQSTPPVKAATLTAAVSLKAGEFQSTPPVKAATLSEYIVLPPKNISIHAAREGGDDLNDIAKKVVKAFQSTPPVKAATGLHPATYQLSIFQSTPPVKAATLLSLCFNGFGRFQSTPPVKAATRFRVTSPMQRGISIHAAREGGDNLSRLYIAPP